MDGQLVGDDLDGGPADEHACWDGEGGVGDARGAGQCEGEGAAEVATHGAKATPSSQAYVDGLFRSLGRVVLPLVF
jgi:hypothetical protein